MRPNILIAEGDPELRDFYGRFLAKRGYDVAIASDGIECLRKVRKSMPCVLALDYELRWGGGDGVLAHLRDESLSLPVVLMASAGSLPDPEAVRAPVVASLPKPFALTALLESVRAALARKTQEEQPFQSRRASGSELFIG